VPPCLRAFPFVALLALCSLSLADESVVNSKHDLSTFGPGRVRAVDESRVCIFCHTPHNASPQAPLWNRYNPRTYYRIYSSSTTDARIDQPSGTSKLCLSCHDGTIAIGLVRSQDEPIRMTHPFMPTGPTNLTTDLSDDHPVSFRYDRALSNRDPQIRQPDLVDHRIPLGPRGELECTSCHDPHNNELGDFLRITERQGTLCNTCHDMTGWRTSSHALSPKPVPLSVTQGDVLKFATIRDNACLTCHTPHNATQRQRLLRDRSSQLCLDCHDGLVGADILGVVNQRSGHRIDRFFDRHDPTESPLSMRPHVECVDCHNPHAARRNPLGGNAALASVTGPFVPPALEHVPGVSISGLPVRRARFTYEVCFRCHADNLVPLRHRIVRQRDTGGNVRRQFLPSAASAHPVAFPARNFAEVPSLLPEVRGRQFISCTDCHNNPDARQLGGAGPNGPHGSRYEFLLADRYDTQDFAIESPQTYALCYRCHDRNSILGDESFPLHARHIVRNRAPCSACHDPHGVPGSAARHSALINFDTRIVQGERLFVDLGRFAGSCTLTCHGVRHVAFTYRR